MASPRRNMGAWSRARRATSRAAMVFGSAWLTACAATEPTSAVHVTGEWGGDHAGLVAVADSATLEYDCAAGRITEPLITRSDGAFTWSGTHTPGHGGPVRIDEILPRRPARYTGTVAGGTMSLTVVMTDSNVTVGTFTLTRGRSSRVFKCL